MPDAAADNARTAEPLVVLDAVSRVYAKGHVAAARDVSLAIARGEYVALMGPSGSGKSTLLHLMSGLDRPTTGRVLFEGREPASTRDWTRLRSRRIGFVFQAFYLLPTLTAIENVEVPMFGVEGRADERRRRALALLTRVGLAERAGHRPGELSGGERQRVAIARSLANSPDAIFADEPTGNLDSQTSASVLALLADIHANEGTTLVVVTHDLDIASQASRIVRIRDGRVQSA